MKLKHLATIIGITSTIFLTACSGSDSSSTVTTAPVKEGNRVYEDSTLSIQIPKSWETIDKTSFTSNVPTETNIGFRNNIKSDIFTANINIAQKELNSKADITAKDFAKSSLEVSKNNLIGYQLLNEKEAKNSYLAEFEGKKSASEQIIHFKELFVVKNGIGYTVIGSYLPNEDESVVNAIGEMLDSFILK